MVVLGYKFAYFPANCSEKGVFFTKLVVRFLIGIIMFYFPGYLGALISVLLTLTVLNQLLWSFNEKCAKEVS